MAGCFLVGSGAGGTPTLPDPCRTPEARSRRRSAAADATRFVAPGPGWDDGARERHDPPDHDPRRPPARRRPLRLRSLEGPPRGRRRPGRPSRTYLGTSHRQAPVQLHGQPAAQRPGRDVRPARRLRDHARQRRLHRLLGRRHLRPDRAAQPAPQLRRVLVEVRRGVGRRPVPRRPGRRDERARHPPRRSPPTADVDVYALTHNETSTGVVDARCAAPRAPTDGQLVLVDATSAAGGLRFDPAEIDVYYFAPQKCLASDGGLWLAAVLARRDRAHRAHRAHRTAGSPRRSTSRIALDNSRKDQTYNTPALATLFLAVQQVEWINEQRRPRLVAAGRSDRSAEIIYGWAEASDYATPFVADPAEAQPRGRPPSTSTTSIDAPTVSHGAAGQRHRRHRELPQARPQPAADRRCSRRSSPTTSRPSPPASTTSWPTSPDPPLRGSPRQVMPDHVSHGHERLHRGSPRQVMPDHVSHGHERLHRGSLHQVMPDHVSHRGRGQGWGRRARAASVRVLRPTMTCWVAAFMSRRHRPSTLGLRSASVPASR